VRIGIDARFLTHPQRGGFKTYVENLVAALARVESAHEFVLYTDRAAPDLPIAAPRFQVRRVRGTWPGVGLAWREQVSLARRTALDRLDLLHSPAQTAPLLARCPLVVTIHDTFSLTRDARRGAPASVRARLLAHYLRRVGGAAARRARRIITVSRTSRDALVRLLGLAPSRFAVVYEAASPHYRPLARAQAAAEVAQRFGLEAPFVLHLGSADRRKNTETLIQAHAALPPPLARRHPLVVAGYRCNGAGEGDGVRFIGPVDDRELLSLYDAAALFAYPSRAEGFGLPPLEAMACGTPVIAGDGSALPEILGDAALLVPAGDTAGLTSALERVLTDDDLRRDLVQRGLARAAGFSWERCAAETLAVYGDCGR